MAVVVVSVTVHEKLMELNSPPDTNNTNTRVVYIIRKKKTKKRAETREGALHIISYHTSYDIVSCRIA